MTVIRRSSSLGRHLMHIAFKVKYCHPVFDDELVVKICSDIFYTTAKQLDAEIQELGFDREHCHMVVDLGLNSIPHFAKCMKGRSGYFLLKAFPDLKKRCFWGSGFWSPVVYFDSVGRDEDKMRNYVRKQGNTTSL